MLNLLYYFRFLATGKVRQKLKTFSDEDRVLGIIAVPPSHKYFVCYSLTEALFCCRNTNDGSLLVEYRFFKTDQIDAICLILIRKIIIQTSNDLTALTIVVLLSDDSLCIFQQDSLDIANSSKIQMTKRIQLRDQPDFVHSTNQPTSKINNSE